MEHLATAAGTAAAAPAWLQAVEASALARLLRSSLWLYPAVETLHILGMAVLVGAIAVFDLRLVLAPAGAAARAPADLAAWGRAVLPVARGGFALALPMGLLLFTVEATAYAANPAFRLKLVLLALALANVVLFHVLLARRSPSWAATRALAAASLLLWSGVLICGRLIAYL